MLPLALNSSEQAVTQGFAPFAPHTVRFLCMIRCIFRTVNVADSSIEPARKCDSIKNVT